jgi:hypothetical protein
MLDDVANLLPAGGGGAGAGLARDEGRDREGSHSQAAGSAPATSQDTSADNKNTVKDANADTNVLESSGEPDKTTAGQELMNKEGPASRSIQENRGPTAPRVDIYAIPRKDKGYDFVAVDNGDNPKQVRGQFNVTTWSDTSKVRPGNYTLSFRPHIEEKTGVAGIKQEIGAILSGNWSGNVNKNEGYPTLSNTHDWNTILYKDGTKLGGVMIHPGRDKVTGEGGATEGCFVTNKPTYDQLHQMLLENSNNNGQAHFHLLPRKAPR